MSKCQNPKCTKPVDDWIPNNVYCSYSCTLKGGSNVHQILPATDVIQLQATASTNIAKTT